MLRDKKNYRGTLSSSSPANNTGLFYFWLSQLERGGREGAMASTGKRLGILLKHLIRHRRLSPDIYTKNYPASSVNSAEVEKACSLSMNYIHFLFPPPPKKEGRRNLPSCISYVTMWCQASGSMSQQPTLYDVLSWRFGSFKSNKH